MSTTKLESAERCVICGVPRPKAPGPATYPPYYCLKHREHIEGKRCIDPECPVCVKGEPAYAESVASTASAAPVVDIERAQSVKEIAEAALESLERLDTAKLAALGRDKDADSVSNARRLLDRLLYEIAPLCRKVDSSRIRSAASLQTALEDIGLQRLHNEISSDFDVVTEGELPSPREQADRIVRVWRMTDQRDELLRWYIQQAITDNITAAATAAPVEQSESQ